MNISLSQIFQSGDVVVDIFVTIRKSGFDGVMDVDAFNACQAQPGVFDFLFQSQNGIQFPDISGRGVIQRGDHAGHAGDLADLLQGNGVEAASVPS